MAKSGTPRHSKPAKQPVTINLDPEDVKRIDETAAAAQKPVPAAEPVGDFSRKPDKPEDIQSEPSITASAAPKASTDGPPPFQAGVKSETDYRSATPKSSGSAHVPPKTQIAASSSLSPLWAGLAGGLIALAAFMALQWANVIPSPGSRVSAEQLTKIEQELAALRAAPAPAPLDEAGKAQFAQLQDNVKAAEIKSEAVAGSLTEMQKQFETLAKTEGPADMAQIADLGQRLEALEARLSATQTQAEQAKTNVSDNSSVISSLESKLSSLQERVANVASQPDTALLIAASALKNAVDRGGSFKGELSTYAAISPNGDSVAALRPFAERGVPTIADLNAWFGPIASKIVATENQLPADAGFWDHLVASAKGLVSVRPVAGNAEGNGAGAIAARMEAALQAGDLERALAEWQQLSAEAKSVSQEFAAQITARRDADGLLQQLVTVSLAPRAAPATPAATAN